MAARRKGIGYVRVSRVNGREGDSFISPEVQRERIEAIAKANGVKIVAWYEDLDQSGRKDDRPGFQSAIADVEAKRASVIVVARLSRFARSVIAVEKALAERIEPAGGQLIAGDLNVDTTTPQGRLMRTILSAIAQFEVEVAEENWKVARSSAIGRGIIASKVPTGYLRNGDRTLKIDPVLGPLVANLFQLRAGGASWKELSVYWQDAAGRKVSHTALAKMIANRSYLGECRSGEHVKAGAHPAIVTAEQFDAAQSKRPPRPARRTGSLLGGIMTCGSCGHTLVSDRDAYRCRDANGSWTCPRPVQVAKSLAEPAVEQAFLAWAAQQAEVEGVSDAARELQVALDELQAAEAEVVAFVNATAASANADLFADALAQREAAVEAAQERVDEIRRSGRVQTLRLNAVEIWNAPDSTLDDKRKLLAPAIERLEVHAPEGRSACGVPFADRSVIAFRD